MKDLVTCCDCILLFYREFSLQFSNFLFGSGQLRHKLFVGLFYLIVYASAMPLYAQCRTREFRLVLCQYQNQHVEYVVTMTIMHESEIFCLHSHRV
jgi:hypothetical protein